MPRLHLELTAADLVTLLTIAAAADLDPAGTDPSVMAMVYRARTVIDTSKPRVAMARDFTLTVRRNP